jgi:hypothetical protein
MYETVIQIDLSQDDLYVRHQRIAHLMATQAEQARDYLFASLEDRVYLRAELPRANIGAWCQMKMPGLGGQFAVSGVVRIDATRLSAGDRAVWRTHKFLSNHINRLLSAAGHVSETRVSTSAGLPMSKPGMPMVIWTPIHFVAQLEVRDADAAARIARIGIGRGKAFGFGCVHFNPQSGA